MFWVHQGRRAFASTRRWKNAQRLYARQAGEIRLIFPPLAGLKSDVHFPFYVPVLEGISCFFVVVRYLYDAFFEWLLQY